MPLFGGLWLGIDAPVVAPSEEDLADFSRFPISQAVDTNLRGGTMLGGENEENAVLVDFEREIVDLGHRSPLCWSCSVEGDEGGQSAPPLIIARHIFRIIIAG